MQTARTTGNPLYGSTFAWSDGAKAQRVIEIQFLRPAAIRVVLFCDNPLAGQWEIDEGGSHGVISSIVAPAATRVVFEGCAEKLTVAWRQMTAGTSGRATAVAGAYA